MSMIPDDVIEQVRDSADLVSIIGDTVELKRTGADYRGPCPFHGGQHRNFAVIPKKGRFYCFVCKESGDVFSWYMKRLGMDYPSAVREVARKLGIPIPENTTRQGPDPREPLFQAISAAHDWFARQLREAPEAEEARKYLQGRGLDLETVEPLELGYAPKGPAFQAAMKALGLDEQTLLEAGLLARRDDGSVIPRFRGRLLFPIHDLRGRVVGFGGRLLGPGEPKYLNSPESTVFHKGGTLYNLHAARNAIRKEENVILVEGYFDVQRLVLAGQENVVAPLGTALTSEQAGLLKRFTSQATLLLDSDSAGLKATFRAGDELLRHEMRVRVATMPPGEDPDTLVQKQGLPALQQVLKDAVDLMERKIRILEEKGWLLDIEHRREALDRLIPTIRATKDAIQRELYLALVAKRFGVSKEALEAEAARNVAPPPAATPKQSAREVAHRVEAPRGEWARREQRIIRAMMADDLWFDRGSSGVSAELFKVPVLREVFEALVRTGRSAQAVPPESVSQDASMLWPELFAQSQAMVKIGLDDEFDAARRKLEYRRDKQEYDLLSAKIREGRSEDVGALAAEKKRKFLELRDRYPEEIATSGFVRGRTRPRRR